MQSTGNIIPCSTHPHKLKGDRSLDELVVVRVLCLRWELHEDVCKGAATVGRVTEEQTS